MTGAPRRVVSGGDWRLRSARPDSAASVEGPAPSAGRGDGLGGENVALPWRLSRIGGFVARRFEAEAVRLVLGCAAWATPSFENCSHGAGRVMSRAKAKKLFTVEARSG